MKDDWLPFLALLPAILLCSALTVAISKHIIQLVPTVQPEETPWEERVEESDTSLPFVHIDPTPLILEVPEGWTCRDDSMNTRFCSRKHPEPPQVKGYWIDNGRGSPRFHPAECNNHDECPSSLTSYCTSDGRCVECYADWHCPGRLVCSNNSRCVEPEI